MNPTIRRSNIVHFVLFTIAANSRLANYRPFKIHVHAIEWIQKSWFIPPGFTHKLAPSIELIAAEGLE